MSYRECRLLIMVLEFLVLSVIVEVNVPVLYNTLEYPRFQDLLGHIYV